MTPDQLSRLIAAHFEPEPTWSKNRIFGRDRLSDDGFWWCDPEQLGTRYERLHARDYTDPEIAMRLLEWIIEHDKRAIPDERIIQSYFEIRDRKQIALAFAKSARIEVGE